MNINPIKSGLTLAVVVGGFHAVWAALVALGWASQVLNFVFRMHFLKPVYAVASFNWVTALELVVITGAIGFVLGYVFALVWNKLHA